MLLKQIYTGIRDSKNQLMVQLALSMLMLLNGIAYSQGTYEILASTQTTAPDGDGTFARFSNFNPDYPVLSDSGAVAFHGRLTGTEFGEHDDEGVYIAIPGNPIVQIGQEGQTTPFGDGTLDVFSRLAISSDGDVSFWAYSDFANPLEDTALYRTDGGAVGVIAREHDILPGGGSIISFGSTVHGESDDVFFVGEYTNTFGRGIFRHFDGTLAQVVSTGQQLPDGSGTYNQFSTPRVSPSGQVIFVSNGGAFNFGVFREDDGEITRIVKSGEPSPDGNGVFDDFDGVAISDNNQVAFFATLNETAGGNQNTDNRGIFLETEAGIVQVARQGMPAADGNGELNFVASPKIAASGHIAFSGSYRNTAYVVEDRFAVFRGTDQGLEQLARSGQIPPNGEGLFYSFDRPAINQSGSIAFFATHSGGGTDGIYVFDGVQLCQVARSGDLIDGSTIISLGFANQSEIGRSGFNEAGQLTFEAILSDGRRVLTLFTPALPVPGDVNRDRLVNLLDVAPFVALLSNAGFQTEADVNEDGVVNLLDISGFVELLSQ